MTVADRIRQKLEAELTFDHLEVIDESHLHAGHAGARPEGETHFRVNAVSESFKGLSRIDCQRRINAILKEELAGPVHALTIKARPPEV